MTALPDVSCRLACRILDVPRASVRRGDREEVVRRVEAPLDATLVEHVRRAALEFPTYGYRRLWAIVRHREGLHVNLKAVYRVVRKKRWQVRERHVTPRPRVQQSISRAGRSNERWATDITHIHCGAHGWGHLVAVIDCHDREIVGFEFALQGSANEAERALEAACLNRFGVLREVGAKRPVVRSDNGLVFQSRAYRRACRFYGLRQEYITPYTPEQNGLIERFFRSLKEECVWQHRFRSYPEARARIARWIEWYNAERPHQALGYKSPRTFRGQQDLRVA